MVEKTNNTQPVLFEYFPVSDDKIYTRTSTIMSESQFANIDKSVAKKIAAGDRTLILALDKSGSMSGTPFNALKEGAAEVCKQVLGGDDFDKVQVMFYERVVKATDYKTGQGDRAANEILATKAGGTTNFAAVFDEITKWSRHASAKADLTVIFFTDGCDTCNKPPKI